MSIFNKNIQKHDRCYIMGLTHETNLVLIMVMNFEEIMILGENMLLSRIRHKQINMNKFVFSPVLKSVYILRSTICF